MRGKARLVAVLVLGLCLVATGSVSAMSPDPQKPEMLVNEDPVDGWLDGSGAGAFAYYAIDYQGGGQVITIRLKFSPHDPVARLGVGFNVYGPHGYQIGSGQPTQDPGLLRLKWADRTPALWLIQVYNYIPDLTLSYSISIKGLPYPPATPVYGTLTGNAAGAFDYYNIDYPGDERVLEMKLTFSPDMGCEVVGFNVYGPDQRRIAKGGPTDEIGVREVSHSEDEEAPWLVQIFNYLTGFTISYDFVVKGLSQPPALVGATPAAAAPPTATPQPEPATPTPAPPPAATPTPPLSPAMATPTPTPVEAPGPISPWVWGSLIGNRAGAYAQHGFYYPGDNSKVSIDMTLDPDTPAMREGVGFVVYGPAGEVARGRTTNAPGEREATFSSGVGGTYVVQVHNYVDGTIVSYTYTMLGPQPSPATPAPTAEATPEALGWVSGSVWGSLTGSSGGAYARYEFSYPGDNSKVSIKMTVDLDTPAMAKGVSFVVYGPSGEVARGRATNTPGQREATFSSGVAGTYVVQVHNYFQGTTVNYTLTR